MSMLRCIFGGLVILLFSCKPSVEKEFIENDLSGNLKIEDISSSKIKFGTRAVGWENKKGFQLVMKVDGRESIVVYSNDKLKKKPKKEELSDILEAVQVKVAPNKQHIYICIKETAFYGEMYHLLEKGVPFTLGKYSDTTACSGLFPGDWSQIPTPEKLVLDFFEEKASDLDNYAIGNPYFWDAIAANFPNGAFDDMVLTLWPNVLNTHGLIDSVVIKNTTLDSVFKKKLKTKATEVLSLEKASKTNRICAIQAAFYLDVENIRPLIYKHLIDIWPESPTINEFVRSNFDNFPDTIKSKVIDKSIYYHKQTETHAYKASNIEFLKDYADSLVLDGLKIRK